MRIELLVVYSYLPEVIEGLVFLDSFFGHI